MFLTARDESVPNQLPPYTEAEARAYLADLVVNPRCAVWVAEQAGEVVGFVALRESWVDHLYVRPGWCRRGIGTRLLDRAKRDHPRGLRLFCFKCNRRARAFYATHGLVAVRSSGGAGAPGREPDVEYRWRTPLDS